MSKAICDNCDAEYEVNEKLPKFFCICRHRSFKIRN